MDDIQTNGSDVKEGDDVSSQQDDSSSTGVAEGTSAQDGQSSDNSDVNDSDAQKNDNDDIEVIEKDGNKFIPMKAFQERISKLVSQRNEATSLLESIKNDPEKRQEFLESLGISSKEIEGKNDDSSSSEDSEALVPWNNFISKLPPEHQSHYNEFVKAMAPQFMSAVNNEIKKALEPIMRYVGKSEMSQFKSKVQDFDKYKIQVAEKMKQHPTLSLEEAYELVSAKDRFSAGRIKGVKEVQTQKNKQNNASVGSNSFSAQRTSKTYNNRSDAIKDAVSEVESRWKQRT